MKDLAKNQHFEEIAKKGAAIYEKVKNRYEPGSNGKFLAIEVESEKIYVGDTSGEALERAVENDPDKMFYLVKVGSMRLRCLSALSLVEPYSHYSAIDSSSIIKTGKFLLREWDN